MKQSNCKIKLSRFISLILRHKPEAIGIKLDNNGWANVKELIDNINASKKYYINMDILKDIVATDDKQRYSFNCDMSKIRANQGHSINVDLEFTPIAPPDELYHGTAIKYLDSILAEGLKPKSRQYVHLSKDFETAKTVGERHGDVVVLKLDSRRMYDEGVKFYLSENNVYLTDSVDYKYIKEIIHTCQSN